MLVPAIGSQGFVTSTSNHRWLQEMALPDVCRNEKRFTKEPPEILRSPGCWSGWGSIDKGSTEKKHLIHLVSLDFVST